MKIDVDFLDEFFSTYQKIILTIGVFREEYGRYPSIDEIKKEIKEEVWESNKLELIKHRILIVQNDIVSFTNYGEQIFNNLHNILEIILTSSPPWKGRGFPSKGFIVPTIGSGLHPSFGEQSSGSENHSHLALEVWGYTPQRGLSLPSSSPLKEGGDIGCPSHSPIKPSIELGRSVVSVTKRNFDKGVFKLSIRGLSIPAPRRGEAFRPLNPQHCNYCQFNIICPNKRVVVQNA
jgi:hypothetical protein